MRPLDENDELIGYDTSDDINDLSALCIDCWREDDGGEPLYRGDEWGLYDCTCARCGHTLDVTIVVD